MPKKGVTLPHSKSQKARDLVEEFPHASIKELGRIFFERYPLLCSDAEDGRTIIRGVIPGASRLSRRVKTDKYKGPLSIPNGILNDFSHYTVLGKLIGILCDIHLPYHHSESLNIAIKELQDKRIDTLILNGDIIDCYQLSDFDKNPTRDGIKYEIEVLCHFLSDLQKAFPKTKIIYKFGNHEDRWERFVLRKSPAIWGFECFELKNLIAIEYKRIFDKVLDIDFVTHKRVIDIGPLGVMHGHEWREGTFSPVNPARGYYMRAKTSVIAGDKHQTSEHITKDMNGKIIGAWSIGCLCDLNPEYMPLNNHNHGFAFVHTLGEEFEVRNYKIINGKLV